MCFESKSFGKMFFCAEKRYLSPRYEGYSDNGTWLYDVVVENHGECLMIFGKEYKRYYFSNNIFADFQCDDKKMFDKVCSNALITRKTMFTKRNVTEIAEGNHRLKNDLPKERHITIYGDFTIIE